MASQQPPPPLQTPEDMQHTQSDIELGEAAAAAGERKGTPTSTRRIRTESRNFHISFSALSPKAFCSMLEFGVASEQGARRTMEDQHKALLHNDAVTPRDGSSSEPLVTGIPFFGVYDGHGGTHCADFLRANLHQYVLSHPNVRSDPELAFKEGINRAEEVFMEKCRVEKIESGSTVAAALLIEDRLVTANVGDSEIVLCRKGKPLLLTTKHHLSCNEAEVERVKAAGGRIFHSRVGHPKFNPQLVSLAVSRAIGDAGFKLEEYTDGKLSGVIADAETKTTLLTADDEFIIIGCDGLWDVMTYEDACNFCTNLVRAGADSQSISTSIVQEALRRGSTDNVTVLFVNLQKHSNRQATPFGDSIELSQSSSVAPGASPAVVKE